MNIERTRLEQLFEKYFSKTASADERTELARLINDSKNEQEVMRLFETTWEKYNGDGMIISEDKTEQILADILGKKDLAPVHNPSTVLRMTGRRTVWTRVAAAASIILLLSTGAYFMFFNKNQKQIAQTPPAKDVAAPKGTKAMITLSNGQVVPLDSIANGTLVTQGNVNVIKTADGNIIYNGTSNDIIYNTLSNPRGSTVVDLTLADGSHVWLNAGSSVTYPIAFIGAERTVQITGEAYFEISRNPAMPFIVQSNDISVQVLGTHFNVNTYEDEAAPKITLLEGSVKVSQGNKTSLLKPGQQAQLTTNEIKIETADVNEVMAWKNGLFKYNNTDISTVMRQISRWYDVTVSYPNGIPKDKYGGSLRRDLSLATIFKALEETGAHFIIDGKNVKVLP